MDYGYYVGQSFDVRSIDVVPEYPSVNDCFNISIKPTLEWLR